MPATQFETVRRREELKEQVDSMEKLAKRVDRLEASGIVDSGSMAYDQVNDKTSFHRQLRHKKEHLEKVTPPDLKEMEQKGVSRDRIQARAAQLADFIVQSVGKHPRMRSVEEMEKMPAGAVDMDKLWHKKVNHFNVTPQGEVVKVNHKEGQFSARVEWKNIQRILHRNQGEEELDSSVANLEILRPSRCDDKDSLVNYAQKMYASPAKNMSAEAWEEAFGSEGLSPLQKYIHEMDKKGGPKAPSMEDHFRKLYQSDPAESVPENKEAPAPVSGSRPKPEVMSADGPVHIGWGNWKLPDGTIFQGKKEEAIKEWKSRHKE